MRAWLVQWITLSRRGDAVMRRAASAVRREKWGRFAPTGARRTPHCSGGWSTKERSRATCRSGGSREHDRVTPDGADHKRQRRFAASAAPTETCATRSASAFPAFKPGADRRGEGLCRQRRQG